MGAEILPTEMVSDAMHRSARVPSVVRCGLWIAGIKLALKAVGFGQACQWIQRHAGRQPLMQSVSAEIVAATERNVAMAGALYPGRALCLEQSLVLYFLLRRQGVAVVFRMGIQPHPFLAHAWVEYRGLPINDIAEHVKWFTPLSDVLS